MKKGDICLIIIAALLLVVWLFWTAGGSEVSIYVNGELFRKLPLDTDTEIVVESENGTNTVVIEEGEVFITHADCPDKLCEKQKISRAGRSIVCLPNRISVIIEGKKSDEKIDVII